MHSIKYRNFQTKNTDYIFCNLEALYISLEPNPFMWLVLVSSFLRVVA